MKVAEKTAERRGAPSAHRAVAVFVLVAVLIAAVVAIDLGRTASPEGRAAAYMGIDLPVGARVIDDASIDMNMLVRAIGLDRAHAAAVEMPAGDLARFLGQFELSDPIGGFTPVEIAELEVSAYWAERDRHKVGYLIESGAPGGADWTRVSLFAADGDRVGVLIVSNWN